MQGVTIIFQLIVLIMSVVIHEVSHGYVATALGDPTARLSGRLTLNPLKHLDPFWSIGLPAMLAFMGLPVFGMAKPVPYNPYMLGGGNWGPAYVAISGPLANFFVATVFGLAIRFGLLAGAALELSVVVVATNLVLGVFNLIPIPPLDGSKVLFALLPYRLRHVQEYMERYQLVLVLFVVFVGWRFVSVLIPILFNLLVG